MNVDGTDVILVIEDIPESSSSGQNNEDDD